MACKLIYGSSQGGFFAADGAHDVHSHLDRSGEPLIPDLEDGFQLKKPTELLKYQGLTLQGLEYEREYSDYWNSTGESDGNYESTSAARLQELTLLQDKL